MLATAWRPKGDTRTRMTAQRPSSAMANRECSRRINARSGGFSLISC